MSTLGFVPMPISVSTKTASYTIPANRIARCIVNLEGVATFTINGVTAMSGTSNSIISARSEMRYGNMPQGVLAGSVAATSSAATEQEAIVQDCWLKAGSVINGTGTFRVFVEEYSY